jgi:hypothetical protein
MENNLTPLRSNDLLGRVQNINVVDYRFERRSTRQAQIDRVAEASVIRMNTGSVARCRFSLAIRKRCAMVSNAKIPPDVMT